MHKLYTTSDFDPSIKDHVIVTMRGQERSKYGWMTFVQTYAVHLDKLTKVRGMVHGVSKIQVSIVGPYDRDNFRRWQNGEIRCLEKQIELGGGFKTGELIAITGRLEHGKTKQAITSDFSELEARCMALDAELKKRGRTQQLADELDATWWDAFKILAKESSIRKVAETTVSQKCGKDNS